jgi:hypothetical protein
MRQSWAFLSGSLGDGPWLAGAPAVINVGLLITAAVLGLHCLVDLLATLFGFPIVVVVSERIVSRALRPTW